MRGASAVSTMTWSPRKTRAKPSAPSRFSSSTRRSAEQKERESVRLPRGTVDEELARLGEVEEEARVEEGQAVQAQHQLVGVGSGAV